jgi:hypothetical protein
MHDNTQARERQRSDEAPIVYIKFGSQADQQRFINESIDALKADPKTAAWRLVKIWGAGKW